MMDESRMKLPLNLNYGGIIIGEMGPRSLRNKPEEYIGKYIM